jgi:hypothetical protein
MNNIKFKDLTVYIQTVESFLFISKSNKNYVFIDRYLNIIII